MNLEQKVRDPKHQHHHENQTKLDFIRIIN